MSRAVVLLTRAMAILALAAGGLAAPTAASATITFSEFQGVITIKGDDAPSQLVAIGTGDQAYFEERAPGAGLVAEAPCLLVTATTVDCGLADAGRTIKATLGGGDDTYQFSGVPIQEIDAGPGNDFVNTGQNKDVLIGGAGNDNLFGGSGDDTLDGGAGDDKLDGSDGGDQLTGGPGVDLLLGDGAATNALNNNDRIFARDGDRDTIDCGGGYDLAEVDEIDVATNCSNLDKPGSGGNTVPSPDLGGGSGGNGTGNASTLQGPLSFRIALTKRQAPRGLAAGKKLGATVSTNGNCTGTVAIALTKAEAVRLRLGTTPLEIGSSAQTTFSAGVASTVNVAVKKEFRAKLRNRARIKAALKVQCVDATGATTIANAGITIKR